MNWDAISAIGEIAGAVAVVATLFYLSSQIRQNSSALNRANDYAQANSVHNTNSLFVEVFSALAKDAELASIYEKALKHEKLDGVESVRFSQFVNTYLAWLEDLYNQQNTQLGFDSVLGSTELLSINSPYIKRLLESPAAETWWNAEARFLYSPDFVIAINNVIESSESS
jgi:hypothetical protein